MYVTDCLRSFAESSIDGLLLEEERGDGQASAQALATYQPVIDAAKYHGDWHQSRRGERSDGRSGSSIERLRDEQLGRPIEVSTDLPRLTAVAEHPAPR
jgi:hypothetical protein